jgi:hypothetical protein
MNTIKSRSARRALLGAVVAVLLAPAAGAQAQDPAATPTAVPVPAGCVVTSAGLVCATPTPFPTTTPIPTRTAVPTRTPDEDGGETKNERSDSGNGSPGGQVQVVPVRRLAFTGLEAWGTFAAGLALLGGGLLLRRHVQRS